MRGREIALGSKKNPSFLEADLAMVPTWLCHLRFEERDTPKMEIVDEGSSMLLSKGI